MYLLNAVPFGLGRGAQKMGSGELLSLDWSIIYIYTYKYIYISLKSLYILYHMMAFQSPKRQCGMCGTSKVVFL